jgi:hypothetical protein
LDDDCKSQIFSFTSYLMKISQNFWYIWYIFNMDIRDNFNFNFTYIWNNCPIKWLSNLFFDMTNSTFFQNASLHYLTLCLNTILATRKTISFNFPNNELNLTRKEVNCRVDENVKNRDLKKYFRKSFFDAFILSVSLFKDLAIFNLTFSAWVESGGKKN